MEVQIENCGIQLVNVRNLYKSQVLWHWLSSSLLISIAWIFFSFLYSSSVVIVYMGNSQLYFGRINASITGRHLSSLITLTVSRKA